MCSKRQNFWASFWGKAMDLHQRNFSCSVACFGTQLSRPIWNIMSVQFARRFTLGTQLEGEMVFSNSFAYERKTFHRAQNRRWIISGGKRRCPRNAIATPFPSCCNYLTIVLFGLLASWCSFAFCAETFDVINITRCKSKSFFNCFLKLNNYKALILVFVNPNFFYNLLQRL